VTEKERGTHRQRHAAEDARGRDAGAGAARDEAVEGEGDGVAGRGRRAGGGDVQHGQAVRGREDDAVRDRGGLAWRSRDGGGGRGGGAEGLLFGRGRAARVSEP
jgi:hypothetical protein